MPSAAAQRRRPPDPAAIRAQVESFLAACREPVVVEPGEEPLALEPGRFSLEERRGGCLLEVWNDSGNLVRRLTKCEESSGGGLALWARRFGGCELRLELYDRARKAAAVDRRAHRAAFARSLRRMLERRFPLWKLSPITSAADLRRSFSPLYARGSMRLGSGEWAIIGAADDLSAHASDGILTYGLIWLDHVRRSSGRRACAGLRLIVPQGREPVLAARLPWLRQEELRIELWSYDRRGELQLVDPETAGNLTVSVPVCHPPPQPRGETGRRVAELLGRLDVESVPLPEGSLSLRVRGVEFARAGGSVMTFGLNQRLVATAANFGEVLQLADELARFRSADPPSVTHPLYTRDPERWLESQVRRQPSAVEPSLAPRPVYAHIPAAAGGERGVMDLLARDREGRLVVLELKAEEDIHAPLQTLDYWLRVRLVHERGDFARQGYFPETPLSERPPRLILAAPALKFHPSTETILRYLRPEARPERVGFNADWRHRLRATFRLAGAERAD